MLGLLIFIPTLAFIPHSVFGLTFPSLFFRERKVDLSIINNVNFYLLVLIIVLCFINILLHFDKVSDPFNLIPYTVPMLLSYLIAKYLTEKDLKVLVLFVIFECIIGLIQFTFGIKSFYSSLLSTPEITDSSLLYFRSVYGLSANSSDLANKVLLALLLIDYIKLRSRRRLILMTILFVGVIITFNRTVIVALLLYYLIREINLYSEGALFFIRGKIEKRFITILAMVTLLVGCLIYSVFANWGYVYEQLTRRTGNVEITHRDEIWLDAFDFFSDNILFGNGSFKYSSISYDGHMNHAHNSFLQVLASHGVFIFGLYLLLIILNVRRSNIVYLVPIVAYSMAQYGVFWGISLMDIIFMMFLFNRTIKPRRKQIFAR